MGNNSLIYFNNKVKEEQHFNISYRTNSNSITKNRVTKGIGACAIGATLTFSCGGLTNNITSLDDIASKKIYIDMPDRQKNENFDCTVNFSPFYSYNNLDNNYRGANNMDINNTIINNSEYPIKKKKTIFVDDQVLNEELILRSKPLKKIGVLPIQNKGRKTSRFYMEG